MYTIHYNMMKFIWLLALIAVVLASPFKLDIHTNSYRIVNGKNITIEETPYQVSIVVNDKFRCGGSILSSRWVLTAAHCIRNVENVMIRAGSTFNDKEGHTFNSKRLIIHPQFNKTPFDFNIGLIDLGSEVIPLNGQTMTAVKLSEPTVIVGGTDVKLAGWGYISPTGTKTESLMQFEAKIYDSQKCSEIYPESFTDRMICIAPSENTACLGDGGSPLVLTKDKTQVGITSFGHTKGGACIMPDPVVFTNLANDDIRKWIKDNTSI